MHGDTWARTERPWSWTRKTENIAGRQFHNDGGLILPPPLRCQKLWCRTAERHVTRSRQKSCTLVPHREVWLRTRVANEVVHFFTNCDFYSQLVLTTHSQETSAQSETRFNVKLIILVGFRKMKHDICKLSTKFSCELLEFPFKILESVNLHFKFLKVTHCINFLNVSVSKSNRRGAKM